MNLSHIMHWESLIQLIAIKRPAHIQKRITYSVLEGRSAKAYSNFNNRQKGRLPMFALMLLAIYRLQLI